VVNIIILFSLDNFMIFLDNNTCIHEIDYDREKLRFMITIDYYTIIEFKSLNEYEI